EHNRAARASDLADRLRSAVDDQLTRRSGSSAYREARDRAARGQQFAQGAEQTGGDVFSNKRSAEDFAFLNRNAQPAEVAGMRLRARGDFQKYLDQMRDSYARNEQKKGSAGRKLLSSTDTHAKLRHIGRSVRSADDLVALVRTEGEMSALKDLVIGNAKTGATLAAQKEFPPAIEDPNLKAVGMTNLYGDMIRNGQRIVNWFLFNRRNQQRAAISRDAARLLMAQGHERDAIVEGLLTVMNRRAANQRDRAEIADVIRSLFQTPATIGSAEHVTGE
ncbi:MAG: hypothetical protein ACR2PG_10790, partial [Hyphomicrobiaceae bacterium]